MPDCVQLTPESVRALSWLPPTCAYRLVAEGRELYWWHPLVSGDPRPCTRRGFGRGRTVSETDYPVERLEERLVDWPGKVPRRRPAKVSR